MLSPVQIKLLELIEIFDKEMKKNNIDYYIDSGTLLGAVRHQGFIPWDDDIDLIIKEKDEKKFIDVITTNKKLSLLKPNELDWLFPFYKVELINTTAIEKDHVNTRIVQRIFIDVFILTDAPSDKKKLFLYKKIENTTELIRKKICFLRGNKKGDLIQKTFFIINKLSIILRKFLSKNDDYCQPFFNHIYPKYYFSETVYLRFEKYTLPAPKYYKEILTELYGNYMELPPESERYSNHIIYFNPNVDYLDSIQKEEVKKIIEEYAITNK